MNGEGKNCYQKWLLLQTWVDVNLDWEPAEYGGIRELTLPIGKLW